MEIYLTKLPLNPRNSVVRKCLGDCHKLHSLVMQGFPNVDGEKSEVRKKFGVLHRLEIDTRQGSIGLLVQSAFKPAWNFSDDVLLDEISQKEIGQIYSLLPNETELMFRLRANPTKRIGKFYQYPNEKVREEFDKKFKDEKRRRRIGVHSEKEQIDWLRKKGEQHGFQITTIKVNPDNSIVSDVLTISENKVFGDHPSKKKDGDKLTFNSVIFDGTLQITDAEKFRKVLSDGIGQGKAYGFGLLSIAKSLSF
jgi:CRISPR system Cascade subunit CasE